MRFIVSMLLLLALAACGARGAPEAPPGSKPPADEPIVLDKII
jgi:predicted small lipoprotein YifL